MTPPPGRGRHGRDEETLYARKRALADRRRARDDAAAFDPRPPDDDDWTVGDDDRLARVDAPSQLADVLDRLVRRQGWSQRLHGVAVFERWPAIAGPELVKRCEPVRLAGGTLVVKAQSQVWATQLGWMLPQLIERANAELGDGKVQRVTVTVGPLGTHHD